MASNSTFEDSLVKDILLADTKAYADHNTATEEDECCICLESFKDKSHPDKCKHLFCFKCIQQWTSVKSECPLCKRKFTKIYHRLDEVDGGEVYQLPERVVIDSDIVPIARIPRWPTLPGIPAVSNTYSAVWRHALSVSVNVRSDVYHRSRYALLPPTFLDDCSPLMFRTNPHQVERLVPWLRRELLTILWADQGNLAELVLQLLLQNVKEYDILSDQMTFSLDRYLSPFTRHFQHELFCFAQSHMDMHMYDNTVRYGPPGYQPDLPRIRGQAVVRSNAIPTLAVPVLSPAVGAGNGFPHLSNILNTTPDPLDEIDTRALFNWPEPSVSATRAEAPVSSTADAAAIPSTSRYADDAEPAAVPVANEEAIAEALQGSLEAIATDIELTAGTSRDIDALDLSMQRANEMDVDEPGPSGVIQLSPETEDGEGQSIVENFVPTVIDSSSDSDIMIVGTDKPWNERTPIRISDSEEEQFKVDTEPSPTADVQRLFNSPSKESRANIHRRRDRQRADARFRRLLEELDDEHSSSTLGYTPSSDEAGPSQEKSRERRRRKRKRQRIRDTANSSDVEIVSVVPPSLPRVTEEHAKDFAQILSDADGEMPKLHKPDSDISSDSQPDAADSYLTQRKFKPGQRPPIKLLFKKHSHGHKKIGRIAEKPRYVVMQPPSLERISTPTPGPSQASD